MDVELNIENRERLRLAYQTAKDNNSKSFIFDGHELVTGYAKYLLEYLDMVLA